MQNIENKQIKILYDYLLLNNLVKNKSDFAKKTGSTPQKITEILSNRMGATTDTIRSISSAFNINSEWLITANGPMLKGSQARADNSHIDYINEGMAKNSVIPLIPIEAMAGFGTGDTQVMDYDNDQYIVPEFTELKVDFMIRVKGSSMYPKYSSGDVVACKKLSLTDIFFQWNKVYVINTVQGALIKRIKKGKDDKHVLIVSENQNYEAFELHLSKINAIALVMGVIRLE